MGITIKRDPMKDTNMLVMKGSKTREKEREDRNGAKKKRENIR